jgi:Short C-terminal domain
VPLAGGRTQFSGDGLPVVGTTIRQTQDKRVGGTTSPVGWVETSRKMRGSLPIPETPPVGWISPEEREPSPAISVESRSVQATVPNCSAARLYAAAIRTVTEMGYSIINSDSQSLTVSFRTGMSMRSWQGQDMTATMFDQQSGAAKIVVGGRRATAGRGVQVFDWGEARSIAYRYLERVVPLSKTLEEPMERTTSDAPASTADQLERIVSLFEKGVLTNEEFAAAKKKLLV